MVVIDGERDAAEKTKQIVDAMTTSTALNETQKGILRAASLMATEASAQGLSSQSELNNTRGELVVALGGLLGPLTQQAIDRARAAVDAWSSGLATA